MMFRALREDLLAASGAIAVRVGMIQRNLLWNVCLAGKHQEEEKEIFSVFYPFCLCFFFPSLPAALIWAQTNHPFHPFQMSKGLCFTHAITVCRNSPQIVATVLLHHLKCYFPSRRPLCDQDRRGVYARRRLLKYSKASPPLGVPFVVVLGWIRGQLTFTSLAGGWMQVCWWWGVRGGGGPKWRVWQMKRDMGKRWVGVLCVLTCLPFTFCLTVWCWRRTCEEPDSGQQNGTPASVFTTPSSFFSPCLPGLQLQTHIFSVGEGGVVGAEGNHTHQKDGVRRRVWPGEDRLPRIRSPRRTWAFMPHSARHTLISLFYQHLMN